MQILYRLAINEIHNQLRRSINFRCELLPHLIFDEVVYMIKSFQVMNKQFIRVKFKPLRLAGHWRSKTLHITVMPSILVVIQLPFQRLRGFDVDFLLDNTAFLQIRK